MSMSTTSQLKEETSIKPRDIAVIGFACKFPGASNADQFWENLKNGINSVTDIPADRWNISDYYSPAIGDQDKTIAFKGGVIQDIDLFDARYFKITEERAVLMDPQQRLILENVAETINHAGYSAKELSGTQTGVFLGAAQGDYGSSNKYKSDDNQYIVSDARLLDNRNGVVGNLPHIIAAIISYHFNFFGPSFVVSTMCSSSLVSIHLACQGIINGECDLAIAGGIQLYLSPDSFIKAEKTGVLSPDGKTKTFSKDANGYTLAEGIGTVLLKPLDQAINDGDVIHAVIKSTAVNHNGKTMSISVPNIHSEKNIILKALEKGGIEAGSISYFEANGTSLELGDPLEVEAATLAYRKYSEENQYCAIGSVEPNIGHAVHASGIARLLKVVLSLKNQLLPPMISCDEPNPKIDFVNSPFYLNRELIDWKPRCGCRRAGISSFGLGGTNCHIIVEDFNVENYQNYHQRRSPLPPIQFNKKRYWINPLQSPRKDQSGESRDVIVEYLKELFSRATGQDIHEIQPNEPFENMGIDSTVIVKINSELEAQYGELPKTLLFECRNLSELGAFLTTNNEERPVHTNRLRFINSNNSLPVRKDIAIIGLSGRYPQADNLELFWENLKEGKDCITEIPRERWDYRKYYDQVKFTPGKSYGKWGGFINDVDKFDPIFFNIAPREAELMDPQERLFLETVWKTIEDAGYTRDSLKKYRVGVFVGVMYGQYQLYGTNDDLNVAPGSFYASVANRVSYFFDFHGPSIAVDTMCSSSLAAIDLACSYLRSGEIDMAIAGGVNVSIHPYKYLQLSQGSFISTDGRCRSFGEGGDGYVPGEGVGAVLLKSVEKVEADRDLIYGVIKASAVNHGGRTNGYTVPDPNAQAELIRAALDKAVLDPRTISYIETHGTGTSLGDPIEIAGLAKAFSNFASDKQYYPIGSVKSNIGHCESAAGVAGVTKVLLQLKYRQLVPSLHSKTLNLNIDFVNSPFVVQQELAEWKRPLVEIDGVTKEYPRCAGISSFGAGGANAHVIIEEYIPQSVESSEIIINTKDPAIIVLSAKNNDRLQEQAKRLLDAIKNQQFTDASLADIAYTLQIGREAMEERLAMMVGSLKELEEKLQHFVEGQDNVKELYQGRIKDNKEDITVLAVDEDMVKAIDSWITKRKYSKLLNLWVKGLNLDWDKLYNGNKPRRISLPTYPFARERYWVPEIENEKPANIAATVTIAAAIQPLLQQNSSDLSEQRFTSTFTGQEFFLADHVMKGQRVLPGVACLEMARAAVEQSAGILEKDKTGMRFKNVVWTRPIVVGEQPVKVNIGIFPEDNTEIAYEIYSESEVDNTEPEVYCQGSVLLLRRALTVPTLDLTALQAQCCQSILPSGQCYEAFKAMGLDYGPAQQGIQEVYVGSGQVLAKLSLPPSVADTLEQFVLHPSLLDSALQASIGLMMSSDDLKLVLPFALEEFEVFGKCTPGMWAFIRYSAGSKAGDKVQKLDIDLCDEQGDICVRMKGFSFRVLEGEAGLIGAEATLGMMMLAPCWKEQGVAQEATAPDYTRHLVMICEPDEVTSESIERIMDKVHCLSLGSEQQGIEERFQTYAVQAFEKIKSILKEKPAGKVLIQVVVSAQNEQRLFNGLSGLLKTAQLENPKLIGQLIEVEPGEDSKKIVEKLKENSRSPLDNQIRYQDGKRLVAGWNEIETSSEEKILWKDQGVYLITGGAGGLGLIFAKEIAQKVKEATLILTGRSPLSEDRQGKLKELEASGACVAYRQVDVTQEKAVAGLIQSIKEDFGNLHGIIHSAGVIQDNFIIKKTKEKFQEVLAPKVKGLVNLDQAAKDLPLDFFILFSSGAGALGNVGQADYAVANAFMDNYAKYRNALVASKQRQGQTLSINWPLWKEGGMHIGAEAEKLMRQNIGMIALETANGIKALYQGLASGKQQVLVMEGDLKQLQATLLEQPSGTEALQAPSSVEENRAIPAIAQDLLQEKAINYFKKLLSFAIKLPAHRIEADTQLEKYGINSVMVMQLTNQLEKTFGSLPKTLFFEYQNIKDLTGYFLACYREQLTGLLGLGESAESATPQAKDFVVATEIGKTRSSRRRPRFASHRLGFREEKIREDLDIAIIGVSGRYPQARDIREFWKNLRDGQDCITEIPKDRWDHSLYFDEDKNKIGKTYSKWGGFLDGVDQFDPLFFNISPREAEIMDPQERLFLECVFETLEDAGYTREALGLHQGFGLEGNVGVYVGVMYEEYQLYGAQEQIQGRPLALIGSPSSIANRVSYFCNFHGPSMAVDTMCSSSLTAIHLACQSMQRAGCELAIAGGVNVSIHPNKYLALGQGKFVSSKGRCESFGEGGDGYVPGEGVGAVLLKPLSKAVADRDHIYGIIKTTAINHGGKTNGYTVPNPNAQSGVIGRAFKEAGIDPRTISYIEAHGTGTSLGDPIEIAGLTKVFREYTKDEQFCAIGSVKSNIGHCESAAGVAGVTKVLLQLENHQLVPSLHSEVLNSNIEFSKTPFVVQQELAEWKRPVVLINGETREYPRRAGVSAFGAGGSNVHIVIEEYIPQESERPQIIPSTLNPAIIVLSAKSEKQLHDQVQRLLVAIQAQQFSDDTYLADMAYTLQVGREAMEERLAMTVGSIVELEEKLKSFLAGEDGIEELYWGQVKRNKEVLAVFAAEEEMQEAIGKWLQRRKYAKLLNLWVKGLNLNWDKLYGDTKPRRISLPTYPFGRERYWVPQMGTKVSSLLSPANTVSLHPLLQQNISDFNGQRFSTTFTGQEFFLADHVVEGKSTLPGVACLEMVRAAVALAVGGKAQRRTGILIRNVAWVRPIAIERQVVQVSVGLFQKDNGEIDYEIYCESEMDNEEPVVYNHGSALLCSAAETMTLDLSALQAECNQSSFKSAEFYEYLNTIGLDYGSAYQGIEKVYVGEDQVLAKLFLPACVLNTQAQFGLHPSLMDSALQASVCLMRGFGDMIPPSGIISFRPSLPFALRELEIFDNCLPAMWAFIRRSDSSAVGDREYASKQLQKIDIDLCDDQGLIYVRLKGVSFKVPEGKLLASDVLKATPIEAKESLVGPIVLTPVWDVVSKEAGPSFPYPADQVVVVGGTEDHKTAIQKLYSNACFLEIQPEDTIEAIAQNLDGHGFMDHILWIAPYHALESLIDKALIEEQNQGVFLVFKMIKALLRLGYGTRNLSWSLITTQTQPIHNNDTVNPTHASLHGLTGSMAKEYPNWKIRLIDLEANCNWPLADILTLPPDHQGNAVVYRHSEWYRQKLIPFRQPSLDRTLYKSRGVYIVIGGACGMGEAWSEYLIRSYQAQIIWISRQEKDTVIQAKLDRLGALGSAPYYIATDVTNQEALNKAYKEIKELHLQIHGVVHTAAVFEGQSLASMEEEQFQAGIAVNVNLSVHMAQTFAKEPLDFVMIFSSVETLGKSLGQSHNASGGAFRDVFTHQLSREWPCAVKVINWGDSEVFPKAMETLEKLLAGSMNQIVLIETAQPPAMEGISLKESIAVYPGNFLSNIQSIKKYIPISMKSVANLAKSSY